MLENGRFRPSSPRTGEAKASEDDLRVVSSNPSAATLLLSFPSMELILSASSLMYLLHVSLVHVS